MKQLTTFLLIRHGAHTMGSQTVAGRSPQARLSPLGRQQAEDTARRVAKLPIAAIYASPVVRAQETAEPLARLLNLPVQTSDALAEIDFGEFAGRTLDALRPEPLWQRWNTYRSGTGCPGGELMLQTQSRIITEMLRLRQLHGNGQHVALVSHGDLVRAAVAYFLGIPLDLILRFEISLASVSVIALGDDGPWVLSVNNTANELLPFPP
jgi:broad specificity phosphatase PhoE